MLSRSTPEYAVRRMVSAISSAIDSSVLRNSSKAMGSRVLSIRSPLLPGQLDHDVAVGVEGGPGARRHHAGGIVLLHDAVTDRASRSSPGSPGRFRAWGGRRGHDGAPQQKVPTR